MNSPITPDETPSLESLALVPERVRFGKRNKYSIGFKRDVLHALILNEKLKVSAPLSKTARDLNIKVGLVQRWSMERERILDETLAPDHFNAKHKKFEKESNYIVQWARNQPSPVTNVKMAEELMSKFGSSFSSFKQCQQLTAALRFKHNIKRPNRVSRLAKSKTPTECCTPITPDRESNTMERGSSNEVTENENPLYDIVQKELDTINQKLNDEKEIEKKCKELSLKREMIKHDLIRILVTQGKSSGEISKYLKLM
jgi:hypothetical protein